MRAARPRARGRQRLNIGPSSTYAAETTRSSPRRSWFASALATADLNSFSTSRAAARGVNASTVRASGTLRPRMCSTTRRALRGEIRTHFAAAFTSGRVSVTATRFSSPPPCGRRSAPGTSSSARTRRACGRPSARSRTRARAYGRRGRRSCARPSPGRSSTSATRCEPSASSPRCSSPRSASAAGPRRTAPSSSYDSTLLLPTPPAADDQAVGFLVLRARALAERGHAPRRHRVAAALRLALAAAVRVVDGVHRGATHGRALAEPAAAARLAARDVLMVDVADLADRRAAGQRYAPHLAGWKPQHAVALVLRDELHTGAGAARELPALAGLQLDVVDERAGRDRAQRQRIPWPDVGLRARLDGHAHAKPRGREDVRLRTVGVVEEGDVRRPVRVVLDRGHLRGDAVLDALEVDLAVAALVPAALMARRDAAGVVAAAPLLHRAGQALLRLALRDLFEGGARHEAAARRRRSVLLERHDLDLSPLEDVDRLAFLQLDDRFLPAWAAALDPVAPLRLRLDLDDVHARDLDVEELLDRLPDLRLVRVLVHAERVLVVLDEAVALLRDHGCEQDLVRMETHAALLWTASRAPSVTSSALAQTTSATVRFRAARIVTPSILRNDLMSAVSSSFATSTTGASLPQDSRKATAFFVEGSSNAEPSTTPSVPPSACALSAPRNAERYALRLTLTSKLRAVGGKARPPPVNCGARIVPARARPVPFWRHGLPRPPETRPRLLPPRVPARRAFSSARTVSCTRCGLRSAPKISDSSVTCLDAFPPPSRSGALGAAMRALLSNLDEAVFGAGNGALDEEQVPLHIDGVDREPDLRHALAAEPAGHPHAFEDAGRRGRGADRPRLAHVVRAVALGAAAEAMALHGAGEALADRDAGDLDVLARLEGLDGDRFPDRQLGRPAHLDEVPVRLGLALAQVSDLGPRELPLGDGLERELHRLVSVGFDGLHLHDRARPRLDDGDRRRDAGLLVENPGHAELSTDDALHQSLISMSTPAGRSSRISESTVFGVGEWMSISRLCVRISKCSRESLSLNGLRITVNTFFSVGSGTGPVMVAPVR